MTPQQLLRRVSCNQMLPTRKLSLLLLGSASLSCVTSPPVQEMSDARQAISAAEQANAARFAPEPLGDARRFLQQAEQQLQQQAFGPARANAVRARNRAAQALASSQALSGTQRAGD